MPRSLRFLPCLFALASAALPAFGQTAIVGVMVDAGPAYQRTSGFGDFARDYNEAFASTLDEGFDGISGLRGYDVAGRFVMIVPGFHFTGGGGFSRLKAADRARLTDGGGRDLDLDVHDTYAEIEVGPGGHLGAVLGATMRTASLRSVRRFSDGSTDAGERTPTSPISGTFDGDAFNLYAGLSYSVFLFPSPSTFAGLRAAVTYPVLQTRVTEQELTRADGGTFPDRYAAQGAPADARPVRANMGGLLLSLHLTVGLKGWM